VIKIPDRKLDPIHYQPPQVVEAISNKLIQASAFNQKKRNREEFESLHASEQAKEQEALKNDGRGYKKMKANNQDEDAV
jgi:hypothetical protein